MKSQKRIKALSDNARPPPQVMRLLDREGSAYGNRPKAVPDALTRKKPLRPETWVRAYGNRAQKHGTRRQELFCSCNEIVCNCNDKSKKL